MCHNRDLLTTYTSYNSYVLLNMQAINACHNRARLMKLYTVYARKLS